MTADPRGGSSPRRGPDPRGRPRTGRSRARLRLDAATTAAAGLLRRLRRRPPAVQWTPTLRVLGHEAPEDLRARFVATGFKSRHFVPHRVHRLPKAGPDGYRLARQMCGVRDPDRLWQIVLFASPPAIDEFPREMFFDPDLLWHQQHFHEVGQFASVDLAAVGRRLYTMAHQSDLVQRVSRRRDLKTRVEKVFHGWHHLLLNAIVGFAADRGFREVRVPTSRLAMEHTDRARTVQAPLFERVYDRAVHQHFRAVEVEGWWAIDVEGHRGAVVPLAPRPVERVAGKTVCVCHDIERGLGHRHDDPGFARRADAQADGALDQMLAIERRVGVRATYSVAGCLLADVRARIEADGHCVAFHSFDHDLEREQLPACRTVDYRIKGYRPPQSVLTPELRGNRLAWDNFEWLASSSASLGFDRPRLERRLVRIPIRLDDHPLHTGRMDVAAWQRRVMAAIDAHDFVAFSLHDCYAPHWLPAYENLLEAVARRARLRTLDEVSAEVYLTAGV